jgi:hypothetical protein
VRSSVKTSIVLDSEGSTVCREGHTMRFDVTVRCNEYDTGSQSLEVRDDVAADYSPGIKKESRVPVPSIVMDNKGQRWQNNSWIRCENVGTTVYTTPNTNVNCFRTAPSDIYHTISALMTPDDRVVTPNTLKAKISEYNDWNENLTPTKLYSLRWDLLSTVWSSHLILIPPAYQY